MAVIAPTDLAGASAAEAFPLLYAPAQSMGTDASAAWASAHRSSVQTALAQSGAVVFRDFGLASDADFDRFIQAFDWPNFTYAESLSNAVRRNRTERVFTANEAPPEVDTLRCPGDPGLVSSLLSPLLMGCKRFHSEFTPILPYGRPWRALLKASSWDGARQREFIQCCELA